MSDYPAVILAGGKASRMGGGDKGLRELGGQSILARVVDRISAQTDQVVLNANGDPARFAEFGLPVLPDSMDGQPGPLAGVLAGLDWAAEQGAEAVVSVAADTPFFPEDLLTKLHAAAAPSGLALASSPDEEGTLRLHPVFGLWPVALRDDLRAALNDGLRKILRWTDQHGAGQAAWDSDPYDPFFNINTPEDVTRAEAILRDI